jgi:3-hydroxybutyryl-CoA dehydrogenase
VSDAAEGTAAAAAIHTDEVLGSGHKGHGIPHDHAAAGRDLVLNDAGEAQRGRAVERIRANLDGGVQRGKITPEEREATLLRISTVSALEAALVGAQLVVEAVPERPELKREVFAALDRLAPPTALLATNTSSLSVSAIAAATRRPERVVGLHFFNPVHLMRLLEVVRGERTSPATLGTAVALARAIGKEPIVTSDTPGFASSRLGVVLGLEAIRMLEQGVASAADIDRAMELGYNHPVGPLRLTDLVGLDVRLGIAEHLHQALGGEQYRPPDLLRRLVSEGRLGRKSGEGFYRWEEA